MQCKNIFPPLKGITDAIVRPTMIEVDNSSLLEQLLLKGDLMEDREFA